VLLDVRKLPIIGECFLEGINEELIEGRLDTSNRSLPEEDFTKDEVGRIIVKGRSFEIDNRYDTIAIYLNYHTEFQFVTFNDLILLRF